MVRNLGLFAGACLGAAALLSSPPARAEAPTRQDDPYKEGLLGPVGVGALAGVGVPDGLRFDLAARYRHLVSAGVAGMYLPETSIPGVDASVTRVGGEGWLRLHPFHGAFFFGVAGGYAQAKGTTAREEPVFGQPTRAAAHAYASSVYVTPQLGMLWSLPLGLMAGFDVGVQVPLVVDGPSFDASKFGLTSPVDGKGSLADAMRLATKMPIPEIHLLELGMML